jgi:hypothetical protein
MSVDINLGSSVVQKLALISGTGSANSRPPIAAAAARKLTATPQDMKTPSPRATSDGPRPWSPSFTESTRVRPGDSSPCIADKMQRAAEGRDSIL